MESYSAWSRIFARLKSACRSWLLIFVAAFLLTLIVTFVFFSERAVCSAVIHFNYAGIESGYDPNGNRFDPSEMKNEDVVRQAAAAMGREVTDEDVERIQNALDIEGTISEEVFAQVTENTSIFGDELASTTDVRERSYFPAHYTVTLHYAEAGFGARDAMRYLEEFLTAYEAFFYEKYGYHTSFRQSLDNADYQAYDYVDAVDILSNHLTTLRAYLTRMQSQDHDRFISKETGYSFLDLIGTVDTIRSENLQWVNSYIVSNNMTKDRDFLIDYYNYKIEDAKRAMDQQDARLYTLNQQIDSYVKTNAIFPIMGDSSGGQENEVDGQFEFSQPSQMYNSLINQKVSCQTAMSETREQMDMLTRRIERLQTEESAGNPELVEAQLKTVNDKTRQLLSDIQRTSDEFYRTDWLENAFQVLKEPNAQALRIGLKLTVLNVLIVEAFLFGLYVISACIPPRARRKRIDKEQVAQ